jgi:hypothetical protein
VHHGESTKYALHLTEFEGGRLPSTDMKIWAQQREGKGVEQGRRSIGSGVQKRRKKTEWPIWPALSLEHIAADKAKIKGGKMDTVQTSWSASLALKGAWCLYLCSTIF